MSTYTCDRCLKDFSQKSRYDKHNNRKTPCQYNTRKTYNGTETILNTKMNTITPVKMIQLQIRWNLLMK